MFKQLNKNWRKGTFIGLGLWLFCIVLNGAYNFTKVFDIIVMTNIINLVTIVIYARIRMGGAKVGK